MSSQITRRPWRPSKPTPLEQAAAEGRAFAERLLAEVRAEVLDVCTPPLVAAVRTDGECDAVQFVFACGAVVEFRGEPDLTTRDVAAIAHVAGAEIAIELMPRKTTS